MGENLKAILAQPMLEAVSEVISKSFEEVAASSLILKLINCYSKLYLNGSQPSGCTKCLRTYYQELKKTGMELAQKFEDVKNRTCKPNWNGLRYIPATARHWNNELVSDKEAEMLLEKGWLKESDFEVLPAGYGKPVPEEKVKADFEKRHAPRKKKQHAAVK